MSRQPEQDNAEKRFRLVFSWLGDVSAYARRRGSLDPDGIAAETMAIAWRKLSEVLRDDPRAWLFATARNLLLAERRKRAGSDIAEKTGGELLPEVVDFVCSLSMIDPELLSALKSLSAGDREALFLIAWEDLSPSLAARSLGISQGAFRARLHRARRRLKRALEQQDSRLATCLDCLESEGS